MRFVASLIAVTLIACPASAASATDDRVIERLLTQDLVPLLLDDGIGGAEVAVHIGGRTLFFNYGLADMATRRPVSPDALFNLASVRKVFEAIVLAQAVQRGELSFDEPVANYVTELKAGGTIRKVTFGQLATHTSGLLLLTDHPPWPDRGYTLPEFLSTLNAWTPQPGHEPGFQHEYTHAGYVLLQLALERRFAVPIGDLIEQRVLKPLGLTATMLPTRPLDGEHEPLPGAVQGYGGDGKPIGIPGNQQSYYEFPGTGQMFSSARDLAILIAAHLGDIPVAPELRAAMQLAQRSVVRISPHISQALAWEVSEPAGGPVIIDKPGGIDNASAYIGMVPERQLGIVILVNRGDRNPHEVARKIILPSLARGLSEFP
jgi:beta-lactamase class C